MLRLAFDDVAPGGREVLLRSETLTLSSLAGPWDGRLSSPPAGFSAAVLLSGRGATRLGELGAGDALVLGPAVAAAVTLRDEAILLVGVAAGGGQPAEGGAWLVRRSEVLSALEPRGKVKLVEGELWRPAAEPGLWSAGTEILSNSLALSFFRGGTEETAHVHQRSWEAYLVLEGSLALDVRPPVEGAGWERVELSAPEGLVVEPGAAHLVDRRSRHLSAVLQAPPGTTDKRLVEGGP